jgi:MFS family permease
MRVQRQAIGHPAYGEVASLIAAVLILLAGQGLLVTLIPIRGAYAGFSDQLLGLIGSFNAFGMLIACFAVPTVIKNLGHFRAFVLFAVVVAISAVAYPLLVVPSFWIVIRIVSGFCFSSLDITCETWFHANARNESRGRLVGTYSTARYAGRALGQLTLSIANSTSLLVFTTAGAMLSFASLPIVLKRPKSPAAPVKPHPRPVWLYRLAPVAVLGGLVSGATSGTLTALAPVFGERIGLDTRTIAIFLLAMVFGPAFLQWPFGKFGDLFGRRRALLLATAIAVLAQTVLYNFSHSTLLVLVLLATLIGGSTHSLYQMSSSLAVDIAGNDHAVTTSSTIQLTWTIGALIGPFVGGSVMAWLAPEALFAYNAIVQFGLLLIVLNDLERRPYDPTLNI